MKMTVMKKAIVLALLSFVALSLAAQNKYRVSGTVKDDKDVPVIGAVVMLENDSKTGTVTDGKGRFTIEFAGTSPTRLVVSSLGYKTVTVETGGRAVLEIVLEEDTSELDEVIVVGYGSMRRSDLTGSVASVKVDEDEAARSTSIDQLIAGKAAGVEVINASGSPDGGVSIRVRGTTSLNGSNEPLYVVDGVILSESTGASLLSEDETEEVNNLMGLNPQDIESIQILKDASATAIYGAAGANGVVLITTKQAKRDKLTVNVNVGVDVATPYKHIEVMNTKEYLDHMQYLMDYYPTDPATEKYAKRYLSQYEEGEVVDVDWQDYVLRNAPRQRYFVAFSGRPKDSSYNVSLGYNSTQGIVKTTRGDQFTARFNVSRNFTKNLTLSAKMNFAYINSNNQQGTNATSISSVSSVITSMLTYRPLRYVDGDDPMDREDYDDEDKSSPALWLKDAKTTRQEYRITPNLNLKYKILDWLTFESSIGGDYRLTERAQWKGATINRASNGACAVVNETMTYRWNWDNNFYFNQSWGRHKLSGTLGMTLGRTGTTLEKAYGDYIKQFVPQIASINSADQMKLTYNETFSSNISAFGRVVYNYGDRYVLTATFRTDGSSKFAKQNRFAFFPSAAFAWRINKENWFHFPVVSMLKLRLGWGRVGNSRFPDYQIYSLFDSSTLGDHFTESEYIRGLNQTNIPNPNLKWETTEQYNVGLDLGLWQGRLTISADAYYKMTYDLLQNREIPLSSGFGGMWVNMGNISNRGVELSVDAVPVRTRHFEWSIGGNISLNRNRLESFGIETGTMEMYNADGTSSNVRYSLGSQLGSSVYFLSNPANIAIEGMPVGLLYGYVTDGIVQEGETGIPITQGGEPLEPGRIKYRDLNGNGYLDEYDRTVIGDTNPKFIYGFNTSFRLYGFTLSAVFQGVYGKNILNANLAPLYDQEDQVLHNCLREAYVNAWTKENPSNKFTKVHGGMVNAERAFVTDRYVEDASYLRISSLSLAYDFKFKKRSFIRNLNVCFSVQNPFVFTKYSGWDPNVSSFGSSMKRIGIDSGSYPSSRIYCVDFKFSF